MDSYKNNLNRLFGAKRIDMSVDTPKGRLAFEEIKMVYMGDTIIDNIDTICKSLRRPVDHFVKYFQTNAACRAYHSPSKLYLERHLEYDTVRKLYQEYIKKYVICKECGKPDTDMLTSPDRIKCQACGVTYNLI